MNIDVKPTAEASSLIQPVDIQSIGIVGAGQMGNGIAHVCALAGLNVTILDIKADALAKAMATMARNMDRQVNRTVISSDDRDAALARISTSTEYEALGQVDFVIEAATEKDDVKRLVFKTMMPHLKPSCMLASNT